MLNYLINYVAVVIASIIAMILGIIWYGPLFGTLWKKLNGFTEKKMKEMPLTMKQGMLIGFIKTIILFSLLSVVINSIGYVNITDAIISTLIIWLMFVMYSLTSFVWEGKNLKLILINVSYDLVVLLIGALIIVLL
jgi:mannitol-specific phosphotransferase system IIBC component